MQRVKNENYIKNKCPNCGADLKFLPGTNKLKCSNCDSEFEINSLEQGKLDNEEIDYASTIKKLKNENVSLNKERVIHCQDCGGLITLHAKTISTSCPFCGSSRVVVEDEQDEALKINGVVPFALTENDVYELFQKWLKKKFFVPRKIKKGKTKPSFEGFYIPFFTFDSNTSSLYTAYRGDYYYTTKTVKTSNGTRTVTERHTRWTYVSGKIDEEFDDVLVCGTSNALNSYIYKINNYDFTKMEKYQESFLLGYYSERSSISLESGFDEAKNIMCNRIRSLCVSDIGGDTYRSLNFKTNYKDVTFKQIMAPIYNGHYIYNKKRYNFICNGQNGNFTGKSPVSPVKVAILSIFILIILVFIAYLIIMYAD